MLLVLTLLVATLAGNGQEINYSKTINEDLYYTNFEIVGGVGENYMIYKRVRWKHMIAVYDRQMREIRNRRISFMPDDAQKIGFAVSPNHIFIVYQYREGNTIVCKAAKLDAEGRKLSEPFLLDSTAVLHEADRISYHLTTSEDKKRILIYKAQIENEKLDYSFLVFDPLMNLMDRAREILPLGKTDLYTQPVIDNQGSVLFTKGYLTDTVESVQQINVTTMALRTKIASLIFAVLKPKSTNFTFTYVPLDGRSLNEVKVGVDNVNRRYVLNALYNNSAGHTEGLFTTFIHADDLSNMNSTFNAFNDVLRKTINPGGQLATTFNNLKLQDVTFKKNGGFIIAAEDTYVQFVKWPAYRQPAYIQNIFAQPESIKIKGPSKMYDFRPYSTKDYFPSHKNVLKSIVVVDIDSALSITWNSVVNKYQSGDGPFLSYASYNTGSETHFLFSSHSEIKVVNNFSILPSGEFRKYSPLKTLASGYIFMPRFAKQVGVRRLIVPSYYRSTLAFVLVDFSKNYGLEN